MSSYQWLLEWEGNRGILGQWKYSVAAHPYTLVQRRECAPPKVYSGVDFRLAVSVCVSIGSPG